MHMNLYALPLVFRFTDMNLKVIIFIIVLIIAYEYLNFTRYMHLEVGGGIGKQNTYDIRSESGKKCHGHDYVFDQGLCPACFAFALASTLGYKLCISYDKQIFPSPHRIFDCSGNECQNTDKGLKVLNIINVLKQGIPDINATPGIFGWGCQRGNIKGNGFKEVCGIAKIKEEIFLHGPVILFVDLDKQKNVLMQFNEWDDLLFRDTNSINKHSVMVLGWSLSHWIVKNSWGNNWGVNGTGRIPWSNNDCVLTFNAFIKPLYTQHEK